MGRRHRSQSPSNTFPIFNTNSYPTNTLTRHNATNTDPIAHSTNTSTNSDTAPTETPPNQPPPTQPPDTGQGEDDGGGKGVGETEDQILATPTKKRPNKTTLALTQESLEESDTDPELTPLANRDSQVAAEASRAVVRQVTFNDSESNTQLSKEKKATPQSGRKVHKGNRGNPTRTNNQLTPTKPATPHSGLVGKRKIIPITQ